MAMEDAPSVQKDNSDMLELQRNTKRLKLQALKQAGIEKATEEYIDALYYFNMYHSQACWKTAREVNRGLKGLQTKKDKYKSLKENFRIRVKGLGWEQFSQTWSLNGKPHSIEYLAERLKEVLKKEKRLKIPNEPPINTPKRTQLPVLGQQTTIVKTLDEGSIKDKEEFKEKANTIWKERESRGEGSMYSEMQPRVKPVVDQEFVGKRIEYLFLFDILDGNGEQPDQALRWCQGEVTKVLQNKKKTMVEVVWDKVEESIDRDKEEITIVELHDRKWNKDCEGAWRKNIDISIENEN